MVKIPEALANGGLLSPDEIRRLEQDFHHILGAEPGNADVFFVLGLIANRDYRHDAAADYIKRALALDAGNPDFHHGLGVAYLGLGRSGEAMASFREALRLRPEHPEAHNDLGDLLAGLGKHDEAAASYRQALRLRPEHPQACFSLGLVLERQGKHEEAAASYQRALQLRPGYPGAAKNLGIAHSRRGRLDEAAAALREALRAQPDDADAHNELGIILARQGRHDEAAVVYREALRLRPEFADAHNNLGNALRSKGKHDEAIASFRDALRLRPNYPEGHNNLGIALKHRGKYDEAVASYQHALRLRPNYAEAHSNLGIALADRGKLDAAALCYQQALRLKPDYFEACFYLGNVLADMGRLDEAIAHYQLANRIRAGDPRVLKNHGTALAKKDKLGESIALYREALKLKPDFADAHNDMGITLSRQDKFAEAEAAYREAIKHRPNYAEAFNNLGNALRNLGRFEESCECYRQALKLKPTYFDAHNNFGITLAEMGRFEEAVASYTRCIEQRPNHVDAHMNRALTWLRMGEFAKGWAEYEWRWKKRAVSTKPLLQPLWNGYPLAGRRILLITEQGLGDTIHFIRYARHLKGRGATVILECPDKLLKLLARTPGIDQMVPQGQPHPDHDFHAPMLTLPGLMGTSLESIPADVPYVHPDPDLEGRWRRELADVREFKVGINWQGNPKYGGDRHRSIALANFAPLARIAGVRLYSLQKNEGYEQLKDFTARFAVTDLGPRLDEAAGAFMDTAAVMRNLDLFITSDTSVAHLAGALGVPVWVALSATPGWPWLVEREDSPWYPTMRLFRQEKLMEWGPVFERMAGELRRQVGAPATRAVSVEIPPGELIDRITALEVKAGRADDPGELARVRAELAGLAEARDRSIGSPAGLEELTAELRSANQARWRAEADLRACEREGDFGPRFIELARANCRLEDRREELKRQVDALLLGPQGGAVVPPAGPEPPPAAPGFPPTPEPAAEAGGTSEPFPFIEPRPL